MKIKILLLSFSILISLSAMSQAGGIDATFGTSSNGRVQIPVGDFDDHAYAVAIQPDGKIVIAGPSRRLVSDPNFGNPYDFAVVRLNPDGTLDASFDGDNGSGNGKVTISVGDYGGFAHAIAIQPDGKILIAGYVNDLDNDNYDYVVVRLKTDGKLDTDFDGDGRAYMSPSTRYDFCFAMALQADGKIVLAGQSITVTDRVFSVARLTNTGAPDPLFGTGNDGKALIPINGIGDDNASAVAIQPDGNILIAGSGATTNPELRHFAVARLTATGSPDLSFNSTGQVVLFTNNSSFCRAMTLQPDGRILLAGSSGFTAATADFQIIRLTSNGSLDNSFDTDGRVLVPVGTGIDDASSMALQPDGKIVVAGHSQVGSTYNFSAIRLNTNGILDGCFDGDGKVILPSATTSGFGERNRAIALQPDGKIVLAGINGQAGVLSDPAIDFIAMRLLGGSGSAVDNDGDGYTACVDCDDVDPDVHPGATEICNGKDDDCDGQVDEGLTTTFYRDLDGDGFGNPNNTIQACSVPAGYVTNNTDCNDDNNTVYPGATEVCDGIDNNCNGQIDEGITIPTWYPDIDGDGYGNPNSSLQTCTQPQGYVTNNLDCNDDPANGGASIHPGATEVCNNIDDDCDGQIDEGITIPTWYRDLDGDTYGNPNSSLQACTQPQNYVNNSTDCNDNDPTVHPGALENVCNGVDNDCDGQIDEDTPKFTYYFDGDGDGWGIASQTIQACAFPVGYAVNPGDCNDGAASIHPGATELCNGIDEDCDGQIDEGAIQTYYRDNDGDGYGNNNQTVQGCSPPTGYVSLAGDCNDDPATGGASIHPGATEICNGIDDDCDGLIDDGLTINIYYRDADGDDYGVLGIAAQACSPPTGYVSQAGDCNDDPANGGATIYPGAVEICNNIDDDCDGQIDEGLQNTYYRDNDSDGYGNPNGSIMACSQPQGFVTNNGDCNDADPAVNPSATEICNEKDDDCDGQIDEGFSKATYYKDADADGYGDPNNSIQACTQPFGYVTNNSDCDDGNDTIHPNATEYCNGIDENCNGIIDDNPVLVTWYRDADNDKWGNPNQTVQACTPPSGYIRESLDCDDTDPSVHPGAVEIDNDKDDDCDGQIDEGVLTTFYRDQDNDGYGDPSNSTQAATQPAGYVTNNTDCNDNPANGGAAIHPGATEICNNIDDDCDGQIDEGITIPTWYRDLDGDGFGNPNSSLQACTQPQGYVNNNTDCNDNPATGGAAIHPGAIEVCNNIDDDCDGQIDEGITIPTWYRDLDGDSFGNPNSSLQACTQPSGYVNNNTDCNDNPAAGGAAIHPGATEVCNNIDDDCDGQIDEGVKITFYRDADGDGFGNLNNSTQACSAPAGYVSNSADCDDTKFLYIDNDGDGFGAGNPVACGVATNTDCNDNSAAINPNTIWYLDADNDNYYTGTGVTQCSSPGTGYKSSGLVAGGDCSDNNASINPAATEQCDNNIDDDCDGLINEGCPVTPVVSINDVTVYESQGQAILTVSISAPATNAVKVNYKTIDGTAIKAKDYKNSNGSLTIPPGSLTAQISIAIIQDNITEGQEYFDVQISLPKVAGQIQPVVMGDDMGRVTILDGSPLTKTNRTITENKKVIDVTDKFIASINPNPTNSDFVLNIQSNSNHKIDIKLFEVNGRLLIQFSNSSKYLRFGNELIAGVYIVEIQQGKNRKTMKVIKF